MLLIPSNSFEPCPAEEDDELFPNGIFEFNITKMLDSIAKNSTVAILESVSVKDIQRFGRINEDHINSVDVSKPVLLAEIAPGRYSLIDGHHRVEKARRLGLETIPAYKVSANHHISFLTSQTAYHTYIQYWNTKIKDEIKRAKRRGRVERLMG